MRSIELLSPARNLECGIEAIRHGADAVYIGAPRFGARVAAGNSIDDIAALVRYAHTFGVRIYVTINTLLHDDELPAAQTLINDLATIHVDALITQDPRLTFIGQSSNCKLSNCPIFSPIPLHSSTQMDNRTIDDVRARLNGGYTQTVLARELSLDEIRAIHAAVPQMTLEAFVHGALCVSYSGRCYASEYLFGRSANRGECAQVCRLPFDLVDERGRLVTDKSGKPIRQRHLLSLRDMNRSAHLEAMMDAGISSFKIEGRLKDVSYVKNVTAYYRQRIDDILRQRPDDFCRASYGTSTISFIPDPERSFNRRFTDYFLCGRTNDIASFASPKAIGQPIGRVRKLERGRFLTLAPLNTRDTATKPLSNGDGLCYFDAEDHLQGIRINAVAPSGIVQLAQNTFMPAGAILYRNYDAAFERLLRRPTAERRIAVRWDITEAANVEDTNDTAIIIKASDEAGRHVTHTFHIKTDIARTPQHDAIRRQMMRLGDTPFVCSEGDITIRMPSNPFIPASTLAEWRRAICQELATAPFPDLLPTESNAKQTNSRLTSYVPKGLEDTRTPLMTCRYCLRHALGACLRNTSQANIPQKLALRLADGRTFPLHFDCEHCQMSVIRPQQK